ncbi:MAG: hypothetical protein FIA82_07560 [Melioribacter sp.]|nr:hypothetical protein [Melioribacter sp.]
MKRIKKFLIKPGIFSLSLFMLTVQTVFSQSISNNSNSDNVENVHYTVTNGKVFVSYDLLGNSDQSYKVSLTLRKADNKSFVYIPKTVSGDIGEGRFAGNNKGIIWEIKNDFPDGISGEDFYFVVQAEKVEGGSNIFMWAGIGIAAIVATVTYIIVGSSRDANNPKSSFPPPPGRP